MLQPCILKVVCSSLCDLNGSRLFLFITHFFMFARNALCRNVDFYSKFFQPTKEKLYFSLFDREMFLTRLSFQYCICFAFSHLS